jgi:hypothetical protein
MTQDYPQVLFAQIIGMTRQKGNGKVYSNGFEFAMMI